MRWPHPTRGMVPPDEFIPLAEQTGVIGPLTELVLRKALRQAATGARAASHLTMAVNVSATNLLEAGLDRAASWPRSTSTACARTASWSRSPRTS